MHVSGNKNLQETSHRDMRYFTVAMIIELFDAGKTINYEIFGLVLQRSTVKVRGQMEKSLPLFFFSHNNTHTGKSKYRQCCKYL
jgi:hypothetical protein